MEEFSNHLEKLGQIQINWASINTGDAYIHPISACKAPFQP
jgi:hypothetical protein